MTWKGCPSGTMALLGIILMPTLSSTGSLRSNAVCAGDVTLLVESLEMEVGEVVLAGLPLGTIFIELTGLLLSTTTVLVDNMLEVSLLVIASVAL